ncbi:MAG: carboxypeptidase-like regulatory domain-containing protein [Aureispira sp.]|nr:carboxypeptidase-like regulatory domain-containing protein [Aureispira sp.]
MLSIAQNPDSINISGRVIDDDTEEGLPFCNVFIEGTTVGVTTDMDGYYSVSFLAAEGDTIVANSLGYADNKKPVNKTIREQTINYRMGQGSYNFDIVEVRAGENPANKILKQIIKHKKQNDLRRAANTYEVEKYSKVELDLDNITPEMKGNKFFKKFQFIFDNVDSVSDVKPFLPAYVAERLYDIYFLRLPEQEKGVEKEMLKAQQVSGVKNQTVVDFINTMQYNYNLYSNFIQVVGKDFISPFSNQGLGFYEYYIQDSTRLKGHWSYKLKFKPKFKQDNTFYGDFWVSMEDYALEIVNMRMNPEVNINLVNRLIIYQEYDRQDSLWIPVKQKTIIDFSPTKQGKGLGIIGRKTITFEDYKINEEGSKETYIKKDPEDVNPDKLEQDTAFWSEHRHEKLSANEAAVYKMIDSIQKVPVYKTVADIATIIFTGYKVLGPVEIGPYFDVYTFNEVEGHRFQLGLGTSTKLSKKFRIYGWGAWATRDKAWKYGGNMQIVLNRYRRKEFGLYFANDVTFENGSSEELKSQSLLAGWLRRNVPQKQLKVIEGKVYYHHTWKKGFSNRLALLHRRLTPFDHTYAKKGGFNFKYLPNPADAAQYDTTFATTEVVFKTRFAYKEKLLAGNFTSFSLGSKFPIASLDYTAGIKGVLGSQYNYHKLVLGIEHWFYTSPVGWVEYYFQAGKIFGTLPYIFLETHPGNEAYFYNKTSFNSMNSFEFVSDFFFTLRAEHHWDGFLFNKIPGIRKLKLRLVTAFRGVWGTLSKENLAANRLNHYDRSIKKSKDENRDMTEGPFYGSFDKGPYMEASVGIENILKFIRVDALWRISYLDNRDAQRFSVRVTLDFNF